MNTPSAAMPDAEEQPAKKLDHSIFEADIHGQALNLQYLGRIL